MYKQNIGGYATCICQLWQNNWDQLLLTAEFAYKNSQQSSTGFTPFQLDYNKYTITPSTIAVKVLNRTKVKVAHDLYEHWTVTINIAKDTLVVAQERQAKYYNKGRKDIELQEGEQVMLSI
ncbi:hypothetical protein C2G38_2301888 [Gigaspora rosea]|uniref:Uncharacterized protein n=1 Tax=Gigaspora rosea TaxID=44941 RepID=A0A397VM82_9GLOM|nr:hypothetical protein C2G38_2301888 [Gigaspora rosea]